MKLSTRLIPVSIFIEETKPDDFEDPLTRLRFINRMNRIFDQLEEGLYSALLPEHQVQQYKELVKIQTPKGLKSTFTEHL